MRLAVVIILATVTACAPSASRSDVAALRADMARHDAELADAENKVARLSADWQTVVTGYERARLEYSRARTQQDEAQRQWQGTRESYEAAAETWARAARDWQFYQMLVTVAAQMDATTMSGGSVCTRVSTASFRNQLRADGKRLDGLDVDHIVPRSLGGADHPSNYQLLPASVNRSQGAWWGLDKCLSVGAWTCAAAVAVSVKCGSFSLLP